jgi:hypothetical protein
MATEEATKLNQMYRNTPDQVDDLNNNIAQLEDIRDELQEQATAVEDALLDVAASRLTEFLLGKALSLQQGYTYRGIWETGIAYNTNETIVVATEDGYSGFGDATSFVTFDSTNDIHYQCIQDNTSTLSTYPVTSPSYWVQIPYDVSDYRVALKGGYNSTNLTAWAVQIYGTIPNPIPPFIPPTIPAWLDTYSLTVNWDNNAQVIELISNWNYGYDLLTKELDASGTYGLYAQIANINVSINLLTINKNKAEGALDVYPNYIP